jgi:hypothetical protein
VRLTLEVVMQNDGEFVDITLLYLRSPYISMLKIDIINEVSMMMFIQVDKNKLSTLSFAIGQVLIHGNNNLVLGSTTSS